MSVRFEDFSYSSYSALFQNQKQFQPARMVDTRSQKRRKLTEADRISQLPDELLLEILSKLNPLEAARTSLLSTRWVDLWTFNSTCLNLDASQLMPNHGQKPDTLTFVNRVSQILRKYRAPTIDQLNIIYPLAPSDTLNDCQQVESWISVAAQKQVKALKLDFNRCRINPSPSLSLGSTAFPSLLTLSLNSAPLTCNLIEGFLSSSPNLEELSIIGAHGFLNRLRISGASLKLKRLELLDNDIEFLELSVPKLESFNFRSSRHAGTEICFDDVPLLTQWSYSELNPRSDFYRILPQLETLKLTQLSYSPMAAVIPSFPWLKSLEQMHLRLDTPAASSLFWGLFSASPSLRRLSINLRAETLSKVNQEFIGYCPDHKFLKELQIDGFIGSEGEIQLLVCIARSCPSLKRIIIHPTHGDLFTDPKHTLSVIEQLPSRLPHKEVKILLDATWTDLQDSKKDRYF